MEGYTFFKSSTGSVYGVSERVMQAGFVTVDVIATHDEVRAFKQKIKDMREAPVLTQEERSRAAQTLFDSGQMQESLFRRITGTEVVGQGEAG